MTYIVRAREENGYRLDETKCGHYPAFMNYLNGSASRRAGFAAAILTAFCLFNSHAVIAASPQYQIFDIGVVQKGDNSQGLGVSQGSIAVGRSLHNNGSTAFTWTSANGQVALPNFPSRNYCVSDGANDNGVVVGTGSTTFFGSSRLPIIWQNGVPSQLPLPANETIGDANDVNASGIAVGSVNSSVSQAAVIYNGNTATIVTQTTPDGSYFRTAFHINDSGRIVGQGIDPNNAARNVGIVYDIGSANAFEVGALPGLNGALAFGLSSNGYVAGSSMLNQGSGTPFFWSSGTGMVPIPLAAGTSQGQANAVNASGWVVGTDGGLFAVPFLWDGTATYRLQDLIPANSGWDLSMNTSSSAQAINDSGVIVGSGVINGFVHAYAMVPVEAQCQVCHKHALTLTLPCDSLEYRRHLDHGDTPGVCGKDDGGKGK